MTKRISLILISLFALLFSIHAQDKPIKVACVGNSITYGVASTNRDSLSYVALLSQLLGDRYEVQNFGVSGATACRNTYKPYDKTPRFEPAKEFQPDIVTIKLGTNDSQPRVWNTDDFAKNFKNDVIYLCEEFEKLESKPQIYLCLPIPIVPSERWQHQPDVLENEIIPILKEIAQEKGYAIIDLHTPLKGRLDCYPSDDMLHPSNRGHLVLAAEMYKALISYNK